MGNSFSRLQSKPVLGKRTRGEEEQVDAKRSREEECTEFGDADVGITEFLNPDLKGFHAILKHRPEDFMVYELDMDGNEVHLTSFEAATLEPEKNILDSSLFDTKVAGIFGSDTAKKLRDLLDHPNDTSRSFTIEADKEARTLFYNLLRYHLDANISATCKNNELTIRWSEPKDAKQQRSSINFKELGGDYLQFHVQKMNMDSVRAANVIASVAKLRPHDVRSAGNKDSRAVTVQAMTVFKGTPDKFIKAKEQLEAMNIYLGNFKYVPKGLTLGDLGGNMFRIVLRDVTGASQEDITKSMRTIAENGFLNYFGMQRFGDNAVGTHNIGLAMLKRDYEKTVDLIMKPRKEERQDYANARKLWQSTRDPSATFAAFPSRARIERDIMKNYMVHKDDHMMVLKKLHPDKLSMYFHAYQSYVWNRVISERSRRYGYTKPLVGDLVLVDREKSDVSKFKNNKVGRRDPSQSKVPKVLTKEEVDLYSIEDVVYPVPGYATTYPENPMRDVYMELMEKDGLSSNPWRNELKNLKGDYRPFLTKPGDVSWSFIHYDNPLAPLTLSDVDLLLSKPEQPENPDGKYLALRVQFKLRSSQYATMMLREMTRSSTSALAQSKIIHA